MLSFLIRRLLWAIVTLWLAVTITFFGLRAAFARLSSKALQEAVFGPQGGGGFGGPREVYIFEGSPLEQYGGFLLAAVRFDWGFSVSSGIPVVQALREGFPITARIGLLAFALALAIGIPLGVLAANRGGRIDRAISAAATFAYSFPSLVLTILLLALSVQTIHIFEVGWNNEGGWRNYLLPTLVLGLGAGGYLARVTRFAVLDVLGQDYVRVARAKGLPKGVVVRRHVVPNALPPMLAAMGPTLGLLLAGSSMLEWAFNIPGSGKVLLTGFSQQDYPLILAGVALYTAVILGSNLAADAAAGLVNARTRSTSSGAATEGA